MRINPITGTEYYTSFEEAGFDFIETTGKIRSTCPKCSALRKKSNQKCVSIDIDNGIWYCFHCGWKGRIINGDIDKLPDFHSREIIRKDERCYLWFENRGISREIVDKFKIGLIEKNNAAWIAFPYYLFDKIVNIKYRKLGAKEFFQEKKALRIFYNHEALLNDEIIIVEGEVDVLSFAEAGFFNVVSVPNGANLSKDNFPDFLKFAKRFNKIWERVYIAVDNDEKGDKLAEELIKRFAQYRCFRVKFPKGCKDANDVLVKYGKKRLAELLRDIRSFKIDGIVSPLDIADKVIDFKNKRTKGISTGIKYMDYYWKMQRGELVVITGAPNSGKSEFMDYLITQLIKKHKWKFLIFSAENEHEEHLLKLSRKFTTDLRDESIYDVLEMLDKHIRLVDIYKISNIDEILAKAEDLALFGLDGILVDPYNQLEHIRDAKISETEYISNFLSKIRNFAKKYNLIFFIVAHPVKLRPLNKVEKERMKKEYDKTGIFEITTLYHISGSANWYNKADVGLSVYRFEDDTTRVFIQKIRRGWLGRYGYVDFRYNKDFWQYEVVGHSEHKCIDVLSEEDLNDDEIPF